MSRKFNVNEIEIKSFRGIKNFSYNFDNKLALLYVAVKTDIFNLFTY